MRVGREGHPERPQIEWKLEPDFFYLSRGWRRVGVCHVRSGREAYPTAKLVSDARHAS